MAGGWGSKTAKARLGVFWDGIEVSSDGARARITNPRVRINRDSGFTTTTDNWLLVMGGAPLYAVAEIDREGITGLYGSGEKDVATCTALWVDLQYGATVSRAFDASLMVEQGGDYHYIDVDKDIVFPARAYQLPAAPTGLSVTRNSDTNYLIKWTNQPTTPAPYTNVVVQRQEWTGTAWGAWVTVATLAGTATQWTDTATAADRRYAWRVLGANSTGQGTPVTSGAYATTPAPPADLKVVKSGTTVTVSWTNKARYQTNVYIEWKQATWGAPEALTATATSKAFTVNPAIAHQFRVRVYNGLYSDYVTSQVVTVVAPPLPPTVTVDPAALDATLTDLVVAFQHNPTDSTAQVGYKVRYCLNGTSAWTELAGTTAAQRIIAAGTLVNGQAYEVQVCTRGDDPTYGPWSASRIVQTAATPSATPATPDPAVSRPAMSWAYTGATVQAAWVATLYDHALVELDQVSGTGSSTTVQFTTVLDDATSYTWGIQVRDGLGLWAVEARTGWTTSLARPPQPTITDATFDVDRGSVTLDITTPAPQAGEVPAVAVEVWRDDVMIARVDPDAQLVDEVPPTNTTVTYTAVAWADPPTDTASTPVDVETTSPAWLYLNAGEGMHTQARLKANPKRRLQPRRHKVLRQFWEEAAPREFIGKATRRVYRVTGEVDGYGQHPELGDWAAFEQLAELAAPICYRDPLGRRVFGSIDDVDIDHDASRPRAVVSFTLTEVGHDE